MPIILGPVYHEVQTHRIEPNHMVAHKVPLLPLERQALLLLHHPRLPLHLHLSLALRQEAAPSSPLLDRVVVDQTWDFPWVSMKSQRHRIYREE